MKILAAIVCVGIVATGVFYSKANGKQPQKPASPAIGKLSPIASPNQIVSVKPPSTPQRLPTPKPSTGFGVPIVPIASKPLSNGFSAPAAQTTTRQNSNQNRWNTGVTQTASFNGQTARPSKLPSNATEVKTLLRASYQLPKETADVLKKLFTQDESASIETKIVTRENSPFVTLIVTTDAARQTSTANFLNSLYPKESLDKIQKDFETAQQNASDAASKFTSLGVAEGSKEPVEDLFKADSPAE